MALTDFLDQFATIEVLDLATQDEVGSLDRDGANKTTLATMVPCLVRPLSAREGRVNEKATLDITHRIYFAGDPLSGVLGRLTSRHRITVGDRVYAPVQPIDVNSLNRLLQVDCVEDAE
jgi:hypothetical protein